MQEFAVMYISRTIEMILLNATQNFPAVVITGPRQAGKTTLIKTQLKNTQDYVSLELPDVRAVAESDPRGFLAAHPPPVILDEIQYVPGLLPYIKEWIDDHRSLKGQFLLSGSQNLLLMEQVTESLAGRAAILKLLPLSRREITGIPNLPLPWEQEPRHVSSSRANPSKFWADLIRGSFPEVVADPGIDPHLWYASYTQTYLERDVRTVRQVGDLTLFQSFLRALAARNAQLLNLSEISRDLGLSVNTVKAWISVLEATHHIHILRPYFESLGKRLVKSPKAYFTDLGLLCFLVGLRDPDHAACGPMAGSLFETAVLMEIVKALIHRGEPPRVYFWRTSDGKEVDFVVEHQQKLIPIEVKTSATPRPAMGNAIRAFREIYSGSADPGYVIHPGDVVLPLGPHATALPFALL